jgi:hypothetical protein
MPWMFEGIPQCGKTTFIHTHLKDRYIIKESDLAREKITQEDLQKMQYAIFKSVPILKTNKIIFDRFYPSEIVFGADRYNINLEFYKPLDTKWSELDFKMILMSVPYGSIKNPRYTYEEYTKWNQRYIDFLSWTKVKYKIFFKSYQENEKALLEFFKNEDSIL